MLLYIHSKVQCTWSIISHVSLITPSLFDKHYIYIYIYVCVCVSVCVCVWKYLMNPFTTSRILLYSRNTNTSGNIIKIINERNKLVYKIYISDTLFSKGLMFLWCLRNGWREIYSERGLLLPISSSGSQGVPRLALPCKLVRDDQIGCVSLARLRFSAICLNLIAWFSSLGLLPVTHLCWPDCLVH